jgi:hypothetical protein
MTLLTLIQINLPVPLFRSPRKVISTLKMFIKAACDSEKHSESRRELYEVQKSFS